SPMKRNQGRDAENPPLGRKVMRFFRIDLVEPEAGLQLAGCSRKVGSQHLAVATPGRPKVDNHWKIIDGNQLLEDGFVQIHGSAVEQGLFALAAVGAILQALSRYPVGDKAMGAENLVDAGHKKLLEKTIPIAGGGA